MPWGSGSQPLLHSALTGGTFKKYHCPCPDPGQLHQTLWASRVRHPCSGASLQSEAGRRQLGRSTGRISSFFSLFLFFFLLFGFSLWFVFTSFLSLLNESITVLYKMLQGIHSDQHQKACVCFELCPWILQLYEDSPSRGGPVRWELSKQAVLSPSVSPAMGWDWSGLAAGP